jgi:hypothetical protein
MYENLAYLQTQEYMPGINSLVRYLGECGLLTPAGGGTVREEYFRGNPGGCVMKDTDMTGGAEKSVLAMFYEGVDIPAFVSEEMFQHPKNKIVFSALKHLKADGKTPDLLMLNAYLINHDLSEQVGAAYIAEISSMIPSTANSQFYLDQFLEAYRKRELKRAAMTALERIEKDPSTTAAEIENFIQNELQTLNKHLAGKEPRFIWKE